jgi:Rod binding domain-containing protein
MQGTGAVGSRVQLEIRAQARLFRAAHEFEAQMMKELIRPMTQLSESDEASSSEGALTDLASEALGRSLSLAGGFGIAEKIINGLSQNEIGNECHSESGFSQSYGC